VAQEVRALSNRSADTGRSIASKVDAVGQGIRATCQAVERSLADDGHSTAASSTVIADVLARLRSSTDALSERSGALQAGRDRVQQEIGEALVHLQFQDRISQVMSHVIASMGQLPPLLAEGGERLARGEPPVVLDAAPLLAELERSYAMAEEREAHHGSPAGTGKTAAKPAASDDLTFF